jgi:hypothetical protein
VRTALLFRNLGLTTTLVIAVLDVRHHNLHAAMSLERLARPVVSASADPIAPEEEVDVVQQVPEQ